MSFHSSAQNIECHGHTLKAELANSDGEYNWTECNLNDFIGNDNGRFQWGGSGFADSAEDIHFSIEGGGSVPVLRARLRNIDGDWCDADINLSERISNENGQFHFQE